MWVHHHVRCLVSGAESGDQDDDEDDDENSQTDGDPNLLLHWKKQQFPFSTQANTRVSDVSDK